MASRSRNIEAKHAEVAMFVACLQRGVLIIVIDAADLDTAEVFAQIFDCHKECAVFFVGPAGKFLAFGSPAV